jgi:hypothetical protein
MHIAGPPAGSGNRQAPVAAPPCFAALANVRTRFTQAPNVTGVTFLVFERALVATGFAARARRLLRADVFFAIWPPHGFPNAERIWTLDFQ